MINPGNTGFLIVCASMVFMMIPGVGYFYSGMLSSKAALSIIFLCFLTYSIVLVQWYLFGYSLVYADDGGPFIGTLTNGAFTGLKDKEIDRIPYNAFAIFQAMFAGITPALIIGAGSETVRLLPKMLFVFLWTTLVYDFVAYWTWNNNGFLKKLGAIDFAGGGPVHIATGASALAFLIFLGRKGLTQPSVAHSPANILLGTMFLWFGWIGFNGGSAIVAGPRAALAIITTNMSAAAGSLTWMIWNYFRYKKISSVAFCSGAIAGLVVITPGAGYSSPIYAFVMGVMGTSTCALASWIASVYQLEDTLDIFTIHGVGGIIGNLLIGIFAERRFGELDGVKMVYGGAVQGEPLFAYQLLATVVIMAWSFVMTWIILVIISKIPGMELGLGKAEQQMGVDASEMGETTYDYVKALNIGRTKTRDFGTWTGQKQSKNLFKKE